MKYVCNRNRYGGRYWSIAEIEPSLLLLQFVWSLASSVGPILGGTLSELISWRWIWWSMITPITSWEFCSHTLSIVNLPICGTTFALLLIYPSVHNPRTKKMEGIKAIDWFGTITIIRLALMLLLDLDFGGQSFPWSSPTVIYLIIFGAFMSVFIYSEARLAKYPLMPLSLFGYRSSVAGLLVCAVHGWVSVATIYLIFALW